MRANGRRGNERQTYEMKFSELSFFLCPFPSPRRRRQRTRSLVVLLSIVAEALCSHYEHEVSFRHLDWASRSRTHHNHRTPGLVSRALIQQRSLLRPSQVQRHLPLRRAFAVEAPTASNTVSACHSSIGRMTQPLLVNYSTSPSPVQAVKMEKLPPNPRPYHPHYYRRWSRRVLLVHPAGPPPWPPNAVRPREEDSRCPRQWMGSH